jgi:hypothetical protein
MISIKTKPSIGYSARSIPRPRPFCPVHKRQPVRKEEHSSKPPTVEDRRSSDALKELESQKQKYFWAELKAVLDELLRDPIGRISDDRLGAGRRFYRREKVKAAGDGIVTVIDQIGRGDGVTVCTKDSSDRTLAGGTFPNVSREILGLEQRLDSDVGRFVELNGIPLRKCGSCVAEA